MKQKLSCIFARQDQNMVSNLAHNLYLCALYESNETAPLGPVAPPIIPFPLSRIPGYAVPRCKAAKDGRVTSQGGHKPPRHNKADNRPPAWEEKQA